MSFSLPSAMVIKNRNISISVSGGSSSDSGRGDGFHYNGKIIVVSLSLLLCVVLFILSLHIYSKWFWARSSTGDREAGLWQRRRPSPAVAEPWDSLGLDPAVVAALPSFVYKASEDEPLECAVCLSDFQEDDHGRLLPKCNHRFHIACIDMWFLSHTTCPLCRTNAHPSPTTDSAAGSTSSAGQIVIELGMLHPASDRSGYANANNNGIRNNIFSHQSGTNEMGLGLHGHDHHHGNHHLQQPVDHEFAEEAPSTHQHSLPSPGWQWRRSTSDRFAQNPHVVGVQFPTNVLFFGDNDHVNLQTNSLQPHLGVGRSFGNIIELPSRDVTPSSALTPRCVSIGAQSSQSAHLSQQPGKPPGAHLSVFKRLLSREKKVFPTQQDVACGSSSTNI